MALKKLLLTHFLLKYYRQTVLSDCNYLANCQLNGCSIVLLQAMKQKHKKEMQIKFLSSLNITGGLIQLVAL
jgi:hypothetical protein